jgi:hypothetical protein
MLIISIFWILRAPGCAPPRTEPSVVPTNTHISGNPLDPYHTTFHQLFAPFFHISGSNGQDSLNCSRTTLPLKASKPRPARFLSKFNCSKSACIKPSNFMTTPWDSSLSPTPQACRRPSRRPPKHAKPNPLLVRRPRPNQSGLKINGAGNFFRDWKTERKDFELRDSVETQRMRVLTKSYLFSSTLRIPDR